MIILLKALLGDAPCKKFFNLGHYQYAREQLIEKFEKEKYAKIGFSEKEKQANEYFLEVIRLEREGKKVEYYRDNILVH